METFNFSTKPFQCQQGVAQYLPLTIKLIVQEIEPLALCKDLKLCASKVSKRPLMKLTRAKVVRASMPRASPKCVVCEFVMNKVESLIANNRSEAAITAALEKVCGIMPQSIRAECDSFVDKYAAMVIKMLVADVTPAQVCSAIGLCAGEKESVRVVRRQKPVTCHLMVRYLHVLAKELHMSLKDVVQKVCNFLPKMDRPEVSRKCMSPCAGKCPWVLGLLGWGEFRAYLCCKNTGILMRFWFNQKGRQ